MMPLCHANRCLPNKLSRLKFGISDVCTYPHCRSVNDRDIIDNV